MSHTPRPRITTPAEVARQVQYLKHKTKEYLVALFLTSTQELIKCEIIAIGSLNVIALEPRDIFVPALKNQTACLILVHNHPSGDATPSLEDIRTTRILAAAGTLLGIQVLDHVIITNKEFCSLRERALMK